MTGVANGEKCENEQDASAWVVGWTKAHMFSPVIGPSLQIPVGYLKQLAATMSDLVSDVTTTKETTPGCSGGQLRV